MDIFLARQPIFDSYKKTVGYELLYRSSKTNRFDNIDGGTATSRVITNSLMLLGINDITNKKTAFINFPKDLILNEIPLFFHKDSMVIEIMEYDIPDLPLIRACRDLKDRGYRLALDDYAYSNKKVFENLFEYIDILKVDFKRNTLQEREGIIDDFSKTGVELLAEKVETEEEFQEAENTGYTLFQGFFFKKPVIIGGKDIKTLKLNHTLVLRKASEPEPDLNDIAETIQKDLSLSYKLLRLINSAAFRRAEPIKSIKHAVTLLGLREIKKWISVVMLKEICADKPEELGKLSLIRARFSELISPEIPDPTYKSRASEFFLTGLFSLIDVMLNRPKQEILKEMPLSEEVKSGLTGEDNTFGKVLSFIRLYEKGNWQECIHCSEEIGIDYEMASRFYINSLKWADDITQI